MMKKQFLLSLVAISVINFNFSTVLCVRPITAVVVTGLVGITTFGAFERTRSCHMYHYDEPCAKGVCNAMELTPAVIITAATGAMLYRATPRVRLQRAMSAIQSNASHALLTQRFANTKTLNTYVTKHYAASSRPMAAAFNDLTSLREKAMKAQTLATEAQFNLPANDGSVNNILAQITTQVENIDKTITCLRKQKGFDKAIVDNETVTEAKKQTSALQTVAVSQVVQAANSFNHRA